MRTEPRFDTLHSPPDPRIVYYLGITDTVAVTLAGSVAVVIFAAWLTPQVAAVLPTRWALMKTNTALGVLLCCIQLSLTASRAPVLRFVGNIAALTAWLLAAATLLEHMAGTSIGVDTIFAADPTAEIPGRMSIQSAVFFLMLASSLIIDRSHRRIATYSADVFLAALLTLNLVLLAGYIFGSVTMIGQSWATRTSPQTLFCLSMLGLAYIARRANRGYFSILVSTAIGSRIARLALPVLLILVYLLIFIGARALDTGYLALPTAAALTAATMGALMCFFVIIAARKINELEGALRDLSLTDELTDLHNRRGFFLLGEQALRDANRIGATLTVIFIDADGLKKVNDTLGHAVGSLLLQEIAALVRATFRNADVIGRLGGDEFGVVIYGDESDARNAVKRLRDGLAIANNRPDRGYNVSASVGTATVVLDRAESFAELLHRADEAMYEEKRQRRAAESRALTTEGAAFDTSTA